MCKKKLILISLLSLILFIISFKLDYIINNNIPQNSILTSIMIVISYIFDPYVIIAFLLILAIILYYKKRKRDALFLFLTTSIGGILIVLIKEIIQRARPINQLMIETGYSFPSGHVVMSTILILSLIYLIKTKLKYLLLLILILIIFSRIYLNVHWFSDVIAGFLLGALVFFIIKTTIIPKKIIQR